MNPFAFFQSPRFWQLFLVGFTLFAEEMASSGNFWLALSKGVAAWLGGSVLVRTVDRAADKKSTELPPK